MGMVYEDLEDHEGYAARRLANGALTATWTLATAEFTGYVAACSCGWSGAHEHRGGAAGREAAEREWDATHAQPLLAEAVPARIRELILEARTAIAGLAAQRPAAARRVLGELDTWTSYLRHRVDLGTPELAPDPRPLPAWIDRPRRHPGPELGL